MKTIRLSIVTPLGRFFSGDVNFIVLSGFSGELGILPGHEPLIELLVAGEIIYHINSVKTRIAIAAGFAVIMPESVEIITPLSRSIQ